jgi:glycosyltransferase involved in cell wall biosynthesis
VLEAMAVGLPVVASRVGALDEMVEHGVSGFLTEPGDEDDLARHLSTLVDDPELRARMGAAGRAAFVARWNATAEAGRLVDVLADAVDLSTRAGV